MVEFLVNNWAVIIALAAMIVIVVIGIVAFFKKPSSEQMEQIKQWLLFAVTEAEKEFGSGTGQIKLRYVYDQFLKAFPAIASKISFESFSALVDMSLEKFKDILNTSTAVQEYVNEK